MNSGERLIELQKDICASLWIQPATLDELLDRDFLHNRSPEGIDRMLFQMENKGWVYTRGEKFNTYRKTVLTELSEYGLDI